MSHLYFEILDAIQSASNPAEVDAVLDRHRDDALSERRWRDIQETAMQHNAARRVAGAVSAVQEAVPGK